MSALEVNTAWQAEMAGFFTGINGRPPDESFLLLHEVFHLEDQLLRNRAATVLKREK
jgi:L-rhamnose mutarotase